MRNKPIFLTGASGNVGRAALAELLRRGLDVVVLTRRMLPDLKGYRPIFGDLGKIYDISAEVAAAGGVIHCASPRTFDRAVVLRDDIAGTASLLDAWTSGPLVYMSSQTVYGIPKTVLREDAALDPGSWYDMGKICNEYQIGMAAGQGARGAGVSLRLPLVFASGPRRRDRQFLPDLLDALRAGQTFLYGSEESLDTFGSVFIGEEDLGRAIADSLSINQTGAYNVASGFCTWKQLIDTLARHGGIRPSYKIRSGATAQDGEYRLPQSRSAYDCERFHRATGFQPRQSLDEIVDRFLHSEGVELVGANGRPA
jgi:nucleoside-diphosphate-sugar epimerase